MPVASVVLLAAPGAHDLAPLISPLPPGLVCAPGLADCLAKVVQQQPCPTPPARGVLFNDVMLTSRWRVGRSWLWRDRVHINLLETRSFLTALRDRARAGLVGALQKGRTSSSRLLPLVKQSAAIQVAFDLYPGLLFCPTRLNVSDDPTRSVPLRASSPSSLGFGAHLDELFDLSCLGGLSRASANWLRLGLLYFRVVDRAAVP